MFISKTVEASAARIQKEVEGLTEALLKKTRQRDDALEVITAVRNEVDELEQEMQEFYVALEALKSLRLLRSKGE